MQKKLLGMAVAAALAAPALALAQSSVQVYGTVHLSMNNVKFGDASPAVAGGATALPGTSKWGVTSHASNWGLRSTESLGGGMTAWFQAEFNMQMNRNNGVNDGENTARNSAVGLRGGFGNVYIGTWETPWAQTFRMWDVGSIGGWGPVTSIIGRRETTGVAPSRNCGNLASGAGGAVAGTSTASAALGSSQLCGNGADPGNATFGGGLGYPLWRRFSYALFYETPVWSGVQGKLAIEPNSSKSTVATAGANAGGGGLATGTGAVENPSAWSASLTWTGMGGRARAFLANMRAQDYSTVGATDGGWTLGGGYDFGPVNVGVTYEDYKYRSSGVALTGSTVAGDIEAKEWAVALAIPIGPGKIGASYAKAKQLTGSGASGIGVGGGNDTSAKMWNLGYEWALSKRTALGFGVAKIDNGKDVAFAWTGQIQQANGINSGVVANGVSQTNLFVSMRHSF